MKTQSSSSSLILLLLISSSLFSTFATIAPTPTTLKPSKRLGGGGGLVGGYKPIEDVKDPHIVEVGKFAVTEHNKQAKTNLRFDSVIKGQSQVVAGVNYRLIVAAKKGNTVNNYMAEVYERAWEGYMNLTSFKTLLRA